MLYRLAFTSVISRLDPEKCHDVTMGAMDLIGRCPLTRRCVAATFGSHIRPGHTIAPPTVALAKHFPRPIPAPLGVAAGLDKDARAIEALAARGFGFIEVGTVTPRPQPGNDGKRLWRLLEERGIRNRMGFNNAGAEAMARRLRSLRSSPHGRSLVVGVNIGKNKVTPADEAVRDYVICAKKLARYADFLVINVSSPNTPGLRDLQGVDALGPIVEATCRSAKEAAGRDVPVLVKIAPDLSDTEIDAVCDLVSSTPASGIVAANTTINHDCGEGGVSGPRLKARARSIVARVRDLLGPDALVIGCGGIESSDDAQALLKAGADLVEELTSFIYAGPSQPGRINARLCVRPDS